MPFAECGCIEKADQSFALQLLIKRVPEAQVEIRHVDELKLLNRIKLLQISLAVSIKT